MNAHITVGDIAAALQSTGERSSRDNTSPILIIGAPRSGTTLLATMLNAHPNIYLANESKLLIDFLPETGDSAGRTAGTVLAEEATRRGILHTRAIEGDAAGSVAAQLTALFTQAAEGEGKARWGEKTAVAYRRLPAIVNAFPDAAYIGMERELDDVSASYARINPRWGASGGVLHWVEFRRAIIRAGPAFRFMLVHYEDLVNDTELTLRRVCDFIGEQFDASMLKHYETTRAHKLSAAPEFAGASAPVYRKERAPGAAAPAWVMRVARRYVRRLEGEGRDMPLPLILRLLRALVLGRLLVREAAAGGIMNTVRKVARAVPRRSLR